MSLCAMIKTRIDRVGEVDTYLLCTTNDQLELSEEEDGDVHLYIVG